MLDQRKMTAPTTDTMSNVTISSQTVASSDISATSRVISMTTTPSCIVVGVQHPATTDRHDIGDKSLFRKKASVHECDVCHKIFINPSGLKKHVVIHSDLRPFACDLCDKTFKRSDHLSSHMVAIHNKVKFTYGCSVDGCHKEFRDEKSCRSHIKEHQLLLKSQVKVECGDMDGGLVGSSRRTDSQKVAKVVTRYISLLNKPHGGDDSAALHQSAVASTSAASTAAKPSLDASNSNSAAAVPAHRSCRQSDSKIGQVFAAKTGEMVKTCTTNALPGNTGQSSRVKSEGGISSMPPSDKLLKALSQLADEVRRKAGGQSAAGDTGEKPSPSASKTSIKQEQQLDTCSGSPKKKLLGGPFAPVSFTTNIPIGRQPVKAQLKQARESATTATNRPASTDETTRSVIQNIPVSVSFDEDKIATLQLFVPVKKGSAGGKESSQETATMPLMIKVPLYRNATDESSSSCLGSVSADQGSIGNSVTSPAETTPAKPHTTSTEVSAQMASKLPMEAESTSLSSGTPSQTAGKYPQHSPVKTNNQENSGSAILKSDGVEVVKVNKPCFSNNKNDLTCHVCKRVFHSVRARCGHARVHQSAGMSVQRPDKKEGKKDIQPVIQKKVVISSFINDSSKMKKTFEVGTGTKEKGQGIRSQERINEANERQGRPSDRQNTSLGLGRERLPSVAQLVPNSFVGIPMTANSRDSDTGVGRTVTAGKAEAAECSLTKIMKPKFPELPGKSSDSYQDPVDNLLKMLNPSLNFDLTLPQTFRAGTVLGTADATVRGRLTDDSHLQHHYNCNIYWQPGEIHRFQIGLLKYGKQFGNIASYVGTKSVSQCMNFYSLLQKLSPNLQSGARGRSAQKPRNVPMDQTELGGESLAGKRYEGYIGSYHNGVFRAARENKKSVNCTRTRDDDPGDRKHKSARADTAQRKKCKVAKATGSNEDIGTRKNAKCRERVDARVDAKRRKVKGTSDGDKSCDVRRVTDDDVDGSAKKTMIHRNKKGLKVKLPIFSKKRRRNGQAKEDTGACREKSSQSNCKRKKPGSDAKSPVTRMHDGKRHKGAGRADRRLRKSRNCKKQEVYCACCTQQKLSSQEEKPPEKKKRRDDGKKTSGKTRKDLTAKTL